MRPVEMRPCGRCIRQMRMASFSSRWEGGWIPRRRKLGRSGKRCGARRGTEAPSAITAVPPLLGLARLSSVNFIPLVAGLAIAPRRARGRRIRPRFRWLCARHPRRPFRGCTCRQKTRARGRSFRREGGRQSRPLCRLGRGGRWVSGWARHHLDGRAGRVLVFQRRVERQKPRGGQPSLALSLPSRRRGDGHDGSPLHANADNVAHRKGVDVRHAQFGGAGLDGQRQRASAQLEVLPVAAPARVAQGVRRPVTRHETMAPRLGGHLVGRRGPEPFLDASPANELACLRAALSRFSDKPLWRCARAHRRTGCRLQRRARAFNFIGRRTRSAGTNTKSGSRTVAV